MDIIECRKRGINIGYCPQVDALDDLLTGEEHLYFYGRIRGISKRHLDGVRIKPLATLVAFPLMTAIFRKLQLREAGISSDQCEAHKL